MIALKKSWLAMYFDDADQDFLFSDAASLLDKAEASVVWDERIGGNGRHFYELNGDSWVIGAKWRVVGGWMEFSDENSQEVRGMISALSRWEATEELFLIQDRESIVKLSFDFFLNFWKELLLAFDDGPLLMSCEGRGAIFRFTPPGAILVASQ